MTTRFADQSHRTKVSFPCQRSNPGELKIIKVDQLNFKAIENLNSKSLEEIEAEFGKPTERRRDLENTQAIQFTQNVNRIIEETSKQLDLLESESRFKRGVIRRNLLWLEQRLAEHPEDFITKDFSVPPGSFRQLIEMRFKSRYNSIDTEFRAARVERDLHIAAGTFSFHTIRPLFFARVYQSHGSLSSTKEDRLFKKVYGSFKDEEALKLQESAFLLACELAGVSLRENCRQQGTRKYKSSEFCKIEPRHIETATRTIKKTLGLNSNPRLPKKSYTRREEELMAKCSQLQLEVDAWKELIVLFMLNKAKS